MAQRLRRFQLVRLLLTPDRQGASFNAVTRPRIPPNSPAFGRIQHGFFFQSTASAQEVKRSAGPDSGAKSKEDPALRPGGDPDDPLKSVAAVMAMRFRAAARKSSVWIQGKINELRKDLKQVPPLAKTLGLAGAIPFVALSPPIVYIVPLPELLYSSYVHAQAAYGACILSFLGGPHWGMAMIDHLSHRPISLGGFTSTTTRYVWSVSPSLLAWFALLLPDPVSKLSVLVPSFLLALGVDFVMVSQQLLPGWYLPLRIVLTLVAVLSMGSSLVVLLAKKLPQALEPKRKKA